MTNIIAQILGAIALVLVIGSIQFKKKKHILIGLILGNIFFGTSFLLLKGYSGTIICYVASVQALINYCYEKKEKVFPKFLIISYIIVSFICGVITFKTWLDILPVVCSVLYTFIIIQKKENNLRKLTLGNALLWSIYDISVGAYATFVSDIILTTSTIIAIIRYDVLKKEKKKRYSRKCRKE